MEEDEGVSSDALSVGGVTGSGSRVVFEGRIKRAVGERAKQLHSQTTRQARTQQSTYVHRCAHNFCGRCVELETSKHYFTCFPANLLPMPVPDTRIADGLDDGKIHFECI